MDTKVINKELIFLDKDFDCRDDFIFYLANQAEKEGLVESQEEYAKAVFNREKEISTAIGYGLAIPHGKSSTIQSPFILFMRLHDAIQWDETKDNKVKMVFMLGIPEEGAEKTHLRILSKISRSLMHDDFREKLMHESDKAIVFDLLNNIGF